MNDLLSTINEALALATMKDSATMTKQYRLEAIANKLRSAFSRIEASAGEPVAYTMSRDYDALYDHLCAGGEAFARVVYSGGEVDAKWLHKPVPSKTMSLRTLTNYGGIYTDPEAEQRPQFVEHCQRMELQWLAPVDLAGVLEAGDHVKEKLGQLRIRQYQMMTQWAEASEEKKAELWSRLHERTGQYLDAIEAWTTATAKLRK